MAMEVKIHKKLGEYELDVHWKSTKKRIGILGASGSGKSLTLKSIAGIEHPDQGHIQIGDHVLYDSDSRICLKPQKRNVGYMFQNYALFPTMTVEQNVGAGLAGNKKKKQEQVKKMIRHFRLEGLEKRLPRELSGGQQQRVALARIMAYEPSVILLDEPFSALDEYLRWNLEQELLEVLRQFSGPALFVSHSRDEIYRICGKACVMDQGTSSPVISVRQLFEAPESKAAAVLSGCKNFARAQLAEADVKKTVYVRDWGEYLTCTGTKAGEIYYVGVRSHYIYPVSETEAKTHPDNTFRCRIEKVIDDVFSTVIMVMPEHAEQSEESCRNHFVETTKEFWRTFCEKEHPQESLWLHVDPADVMVLR